MGIRKARQPAAAPLGEVTGADGLVVVHVSPHPDDEAVGCPATIGALVRAGFPVLNVLTSLGPPGARDRRRREARAAAEVAGIRLILADTGDLPLPEYEQAVTTAVLTEVGAAPAIVISPSPHDNHPRHEAAGRAAAATVAALGERARWWMYAVWGALPLPTLVHAFGPEELAGADRLLECYAGEIARNDYRALVHARSIANRILGMEQVFGFGSEQAIPAPYVELFTEATALGGRWTAGMPRFLEPAAPVTDPGGHDITAWVEQSSPRRLVQWPP